MGHLILMSRHDLNLRRKHELLVLDYKLHSLELERKLESVSYGLKGVGHSFLA